IQVAPLFSNVPLGRGIHTIYWEGTDREGNVIAPPRFDSFSINFGGFELPQNAIFVESAPQITDVAANPNYLDPFTGDFSTGPGQATKITFTVTKSARVIVQVFSVETNVLLRTVTLPNIGAGGAVIQWDGRTDSGLFAAPGSYRLALKAVDAGG